MNKIFASNVGTVDRAARLLIGVAALGMVFVGPQSLWGLLGIVPLATGLIGSCPAYSLVGINTGRKPASVPQTQS